MLCRIKVLQTLACPLCRVSRRLDRPRTNRPAERTPFDHPVGLANLFGVELSKAFLLFLPTSGRSVPALLLSPSGLSVTTTLAPEDFRAQVMALHFFSVGFGTSMSGVLARYYDPAHEFAYFGIIGAVAIGAGVIVFAIAPWISRLMDGGH